jgi:hypothetical protein
VELYFSGESARSLFLCRFGGRREGGTLFLRLVVRVRINLLWCIVGMVGATSEQINLLQLYSHISFDFYSDVSELMASCACRSLRSAAWSSRRSSDLARSVSRCVIGLRWWPGQGGFSGMRMLVLRWWVCCSSPTLSMGGERSWSKTARGCPPVDVPQWHVPCCVQWACSSTHKATLVMVLSWICQWWRLGVLFGVRLGGAVVGQRPLASVVAGNLRDRFVFLNLLRFYL